ncbi:phosphoadenylyl-sulfate reductase [Coralliovum pocilloporae]|uniref:phosphoadenylyl-sulfate reductase n=1 Tax=Coralliovum pocilloporae TaxID=3066369 RepID=UPI0033075CCA
MADAALRKSAEECTSERAAALEAQYGHLSAEEVLKIAITEVFEGQIALVSSFGADSSVMLNMISDIAPDLPVVFLDTGKHFGETRRYGKVLEEKLGLTNVQTVLPDADRLAELDKGGFLFSTNHDLCCHIRKTEPLERALEPFAASITGRKRFQNSARDRLPVFEADGTRIKVNPLASWSFEDLVDYREQHDLPAHPLVEQGFLSIGCMPCTSPVEPGEDQRAGRWRGTGKTECGIHIKTPKGETFIRRD